MTDVDRCDTPFPRPTRPLHALDDRHDQRPHPRRLTLTRSIHDPILRSRRHGGHHEPVASCASPRHRRHAQDARTAPDGVVPGAEVGHRVANHGVSRNGASAAPWVAADDHGNLPRVDRQWGGSVIAGTAPSPTFVGVASGRGYSDACLRMVGIERAIERGRPAPIGASTMPRPALECAVPHELGHRVASIGVRKGRCRPPRSMGMRATRSVTSVGERVVVVMFIGGGVVVSVVGWRRSFRRDFGDCCSG